MIRLAVITTILLLLGSPTQAQQTPPSIVNAYDSLADAILGVKQVEHDLVLTLLDHHRLAAHAQLEAGHYGEAAAHIALFANEGDNAVAGVRKRLLEGGHHHNAAGEAQGIFEPGYVIITRVGKKTLLEASAAMREFHERQVAMSQDIVQRNVDLMIKLAKELTQLLKM
jgi:hypothetical protein